MPTNPGPPHTCGRCPLWSGAVAEMGHQRALGTCPLVRRGQPQWLQGDCVRLASCVAPWLHTRHTHTEEAGKILQ